MRRIESAAKKALLNAYGMSMRSKGEIIGILDRDQRSGVRDQKKNDLRETVRIYFGRGGLTTKTGNRE
jgi:hypothetical protein